MTPEEKERLASLERWRYPTPTNRTILMTTEAGTEVDCVGFNARGYEMYRVYNNGFLDIIPYPFLTDTVLKVENVVIEWTLLKLKK